jgi:hypothetical protein
LHPATALGAASCCGYHLAAAIKGERTNKRESLLH